MTSPTAPLRDCVLLQVPVRLWARTQEQTDALVRELALVAAGGNDHETPRRLTNLIAALEAGFGEATTNQEEQLFAAVEDGVEVIEELHYQLPIAAGPASRELGAMLDEADDFCAQGKHLLTLAADPEVVALRRWWLEQLASQLEGAPPVPWPAGA